MFTQCPECGTTFRVTAEVLKQAAGKVRCGSCSHAFNALQYLSETKPTNKIEPATPSPLPELKPDSVDGHPKDKLSMDQSSMDESTVDDLPMDHIPMDDLSVDELPIDESPLEELTIDELPMDTSSMSAAAEESSALLKTLDDLATSDIRIDDSGVEWRVFEEDEEEEVAAPVTQIPTPQVNDTQAAEAASAKENTGSVSWLFEGGTIDTKAASNKISVVTTIPPSTSKDEETKDERAEAPTEADRTNQETSPAAADQAGEETIDDGSDTAINEELRFDDNTPLPDDFDIEEESPVGEDSPAVEDTSLSIAPEGPAEATKQNTTEPENPQAHLALGDADEWEELLGEVDKTKTVEEVPDTAESADLEVDPIDEIDAVNDEEAGVHATDDIAYDDETGIREIEDIAYDDETGIREVESIAAVDESAVDEIAYDDETGIREVDGPTAVDDEETGVHAVGESAYNDRQEDSDEQGVSDSPPTVGEQFDMQAEAMGIDLTGIYEQEILGRAEETDAQEDEDAPLEFLDEDLDEDPLGVLGNDSPDDSPADGPVELSLVDPDSEPPEAGPSGDDMFAATFESELVSAELEAAAEAMNDIADSEIADSEVTDSERVDSETADLEMGDAAKFDTDDDFDDKIEDVELDLEIEVEDEDPSPDMPFTAPQMGAEEAANRAIDQELLAIAQQEQDGTASAIFQQPFDTDDVAVETIVMEGERIRDAVDEEALAAELAAMQEPMDPIVIPPETTTVETSKRRPITLFLIVGAGLLLVLLALQFLHQSRESLATNPAFNSLAGPIYRALGQPVTPSWDITGWRFEATKGSTDGNDELLTIFSRIGNTSAKPLPYPLISVSLTDRFEDIMGSRVLEPAEYLAAASDTRRPVAPGSTFNAVIAIESPDVNATGFKLNVCYRLTGGRLRCAVEDFK